MVKNRIENSSCENSMSASKLYVAMYHYTRDFIHSRYSKIKGLDIKLFRQQLDFFKYNFNVVSMEQVIESIKNKNLPDNALLLTFDDGYIDNYTYVFPLLEEYGFQGSFFIPGKTFMTHQLLDVNKIHYILASACIDNLIVDLKERMNFYRGDEFEYPENDELFEKYAIADRMDSKETIFIKRILQTVLPEQLRNRISSDLFKKYVGVPEEQIAYELYMTADQICVLKRHGMFIGIHGYDHYWLGKLCEDEMKKDIDKALMAMDPFINRNCWVMNYPYGNYNQNTIDYIKKRGACLGFTTEVNIADLSVNDALKLPRLDCNDFPPKSKNYRKM